MPRFSFILYFLVRFRSLLTVVPRRRSCLIWLIFIGAIFMNVSNGP